MNGKNRKLGNLSLLMYCLLFVLVAQVINACNVPVFRYALEKWYPHCYETYIFYRGSLDVDVQEMVTELKEKHALNGTPCNIAVIPVDMNKSQLSGVRKIYSENVKGKRMPVMVIKTPANKASPTKVVWVKKLSKNSLMEVVESPVRTTLYDKIMTGESAVWLLFTSGDKKRDDAARKMLKASIEHLNKTCKMPDGVISPGEEVTADNFENMLASSVPLKISFSLLEVAQSDLDEEFLMTIIKASGIGDKEIGGGPFIAPVFGQGRVASVITEKNITLSSLNTLGQYISGACSCMAKAENIGFDLLMMANWVKSVNMLIVDKNLPPVIGAGALVESKCTSSTVENEITEQENEPQREVSKALIGLILVAIALLVTGSLMISKNSN